LAGALFVVLALRDKILQKQSRSDCTTEESWLLICRSRCRRWCEYAGLGDGCWCGAPELPGGEAAMAREQLWRRSLNSAPLKSRAKTGQDSFHGWVFVAQHFRFLQQTALFVRRDQDDQSSAPASKLAGGVQELLMRDNHESLFSLWP